MYVKTFISHNTSFDKAVKEVSLQTKEHFSGQKRADLVLLFVSPHHSPCYFKAPLSIKEELPSSTILGCSARSTMGAKDAETPSVEMVVLSLPGVAISEFEFTQETLPNADGPPSSWRKVIKPIQKMPDSMIVFADPFSINTRDVLDGLDFAYPSTKKFGALASGDLSSPKHAVFTSTKTLMGGLGGVSLSGNIKVESGVANYCSPIGNPLIVTDVNDNQILELNNEKPTVVLENLIEKMDKESRKNLASSLTLGISTGGSNGKFKIRNIRLIDTFSGNLVVGDSIDPGSIVQFHVRSSSKSDYSEVKELAKKHAQFGLVFGCVSKDLQSTKKELSSVFKEGSYGGILCNGQIVSDSSGSTTLLGYSAVTSFFSPFNNDGPLDDSKKDNQSLTNSRTK